MDRTTYPLGVIPARMGSTRFPNKPLATILKKPMIQRVWEAAVRSGRLSEVVIATDSHEIKRVAEGFGAVAVLTPKNCKTGSERVAWVAREAGGAGDSIVVNLQGDEPLLQPQDIDGLVDCLGSNPHFQMATLAVRKINDAELLNPNVVKVVVSHSGQALYFSRSPLRASNQGQFYKHIGVYAFRQQTLLRLLDLPSGALEEAERLEQLRALEHGIPIQVVEASHDTIGVDVPEDILSVESILNANLNNEDGVALS